MESQLKQIGRRIQEVRNILEISSSEMASIHGISEEEYLRHERGEVDISFTFLYRCAERFHMDIGTLVTGETPKLSFYSLTRKNEGMPIRRRAGFEYLHQAANFKDREAEPFIVTAPFISDDEEIHLSRHAGQEFDYILEGALRVRMEDHEEILHAGDSIYYDSGHQHGMVAAEGKKCVFLAIVFKGKEEEGVEEKKDETSSVRVAKRELVCQKYVNETLDGNGNLAKISFNVPADFNFAFDVVDHLAEKSPDKRAMRWVSNDGVVKDFTFKDVSEESSKAANYFSSLGIRKGDRVMLVMKRHHQFWPVIIALHKIGAVAVPATNQLVTKDFEYRFNAASVKAIVCSPDGDITKYVDEAQKNSPSLEIKIVVNSEKPSWRFYDREVEMFSDKFKRPAGHLATDPMLLYFSSGTTGYPKMVVHNYKYPIGHIVTARWWHNVDPDGLHFTISDTGWGKSAWGKLYGQWFSETAVFVYDFNKFAAQDILPLFKRHNITTFCAPPTMYRFFIKEDLKLYDFSTLKHACTAGEALNPEVYQQFYAATGLKIMEGFGQTESTLLIANLAGMQPKPGSMGKPSPQFEIDLFDADGKSVATGHVGEIVVKAERDQVCGIFSGYFRDEEKTAASWHDGYFHTGDTAWRDEDGYFWYVGRVDDLIKSSGYRIGPFEIESVLMELPYVLECAVTGVPDPVRGQVVKATIVLTRGTEGTEQLKKDIQNYVKSHTAPYKYPRVVEFIDELPKTASGKIRRNVLREKNNAAKA